MNEPGFLRYIATIEQNGKTYRGPPQPPLSRRPSNITGAGSARLRSVSRSEPKPRLPSYPSTRESRCCPATATHRRTVPHLNPERRQWESRPHVSILAFCVNQRRPVSTLRCSSFRRNPRCGLADGSTRHHHAAVGSTASGHRAVVYDYPWRRRPRQLRHLRTRRRNRCSAARVSRLRPRQRLSDEPSQMGQREYSHHRRQPGGALFP